MRANTQKILTLAHKIRRMSRLVSCTISMPRTTMAPPLQRLTNLIPAVPVKEALLNRDSKITISDRRTATREELPNLGAFCYQCEPVTAPSLTFCPSSSSPQRSLSKFAWLLPVFIITAKVDLRFLFMKMARETLCDFCSTVFIAFHLTLYQTLQDQWRNLFFKSDVGFHSSLVFSLSVETVFKCIIVLSHWSMFLLFPRLQLGFPVFGFLVAWLLFNSFALCKGVKIEAGVNCLLKVVGFHLENSLVLITTHSLLDLIKLSTLLVGFEPLLEGIVVGKVVLLKGYLRGLFSFLSFSGLLVLSGRC
mmetsp:Transcript_4420/g.16659  ORF Transcript_4420/g.16659 Transcript_4420/m.16659 type:complete len:306 (-) Transcript_4420:1337-2254(-)